MSPCTDPRKQCPICNNLFSHRPGPNNSICATCEEVRQSDIVEDYIQSLDFGDEYDDEIQGLVAGNIRSFAGTFRDLIEEEIKQRPKKQKRSKMYFIEFTPRSLDGTIYAYTGILRAPSSNDPNHWIMFARKKDAERVALQLGGQPKVRKCRKGDFEV